MYHHLPILRLKVFYCQILADPSWEKASPLQTVFQGLGMIDLYLDKGLGVANRIDIKYSNKYDTIRKIDMQ